MWLDFSSDSGIFEDVHTLSNGRFLEAQLPANFLHSVGERDLVEHGVIRVQGVSNFVQCHRRIHQQFSIFGYGTFLEEVPNLVTTFDEIPIPALGCTGVDGAEYFSLLLRGIFVKVLAGFQQLFGFFCRQEIVNYGVAVLQYLTDQLVPHGVPTIPEMLLVLSQLTAPKLIQNPCQPVDYSRAPLAMRMARAVWLYYICKVIELLDTVFFVLRKKQNQVSFLHLYHHTLMPVCGFIGVKYFAGGHGTLLGVINSFIHVCMYAYYMLAAMGPKVQKYLWWKRYLTVMQIIQFIIVFYHTLQVQFQPTCGYPKSIAALLTLNAGLFIYMFSTFYVRSYLRTARRNAAAELANSQNNIINNNNNNQAECKPKEMPQPENSRTPNGNAVAVGDESKKDL